MRVTESEQSGGAAASRAAAAILALGVLLRFFGLGRRQLWLDEIIQLRRFAEGGLIDRVLNLNQEIAAAPLDYLAQHAVVSLAGRGEWAARLHAALFGCLALWVFFLFCRRLLPRRAALAALLLLAVSPLHVWYSQEGRGYSLFFLLAVAGYFALWEALEKGGWGRWASYGLILTLCLYSNYLGLAVWAAQAAFVLGLTLLFGKLRAGGPRGGSAAAFAGVSGLALVAFTPWLIHTSSAARAQVPSVFVEAGLWARLFKEISGGGYPLSLLLSILFLAGAWTLWRRGETVRLWLLLSWLALPAVAALLLVWWRGYFLAIRQLLVCTAPLLAGAGLGLAAPQPRGRQRSGLAALAAAVLAVAISLGAVWKHYGEEEADWKSLTRCLSGLEPGVAVVAPNIEFALSYFLEDLPGRSRPLHPGEIAAALCREPGAVVALAESRYMDAAQLAAARRLKEASEILKTERFHGFEVRLIGCPRGNGR